MLSTQELSDLNQFIDTDYFEIGDLEQRTAKFSRRYDGRKLLDAIGVYGISSNMISKIEEYARSYFMLLQAREKSAVDLFEVYEKEQKSNGHITRAVLLSVSVASSSLVSNPFVGMSIEFLTIGLFRIIRKTNRKIYKVYIEAGNSLDEALEIFTAEWDRYEQQTAKYHLGLQQLST